MTIVKFIAVVIIGYLVGSIPFGVLIARRVAGVDVRDYGSGKMGSTNVLRVAGKKAAAWGLAQQTRTAAFLGPPVVLKLVAAIFPAGRERPGTARRPHVGCKAGRCGRA